MTSLVIAEKPSVAQAISKVLCAKSKKGGYLTGPGYIVSWCFGHLVELAPPEAYDEKYGKWRYADLPIIPPEWKHAAAPDKAKQLDVLRRLMADSQVDTIINACDAGREGELIFRLVYELSGCKKPVQRLWISSMEDSAIAGGFRSLRPGADYDRLYLSALCRAQADWIVGINATRLFSVLYRGATLNVGRVQSPTLAMIVEREGKIAAFQKEKFYTIDLDCGDFKAVSGRVDDLAAAEALRAACDGDGAAVKTVERTEKTAQPPKLYDLTALQREANRLFGYTAQQTLDCVQSLYEKKLCTYPRTDSRYITGDMRDSIPGLVDTIAAALPFVGGLDLPVDTGRIVNDDKVSDHHAILPTVQIVSIILDTLPTAERNILTMLAARLLCAVGKKHAYTETRMELECGGGLFTAKGRTVTADGWKAVDTVFKAMAKAKQDEDSEQDGALPLLERGHLLHPVQASLLERFTSPPKHYTEDTLLSAMESAGAEDMPDDVERKGLGTPATRAGIIEKLVKSGFLERKGKNIVSTKKGENLITVLPDTLKSPALTAEWENRLKEVERGEMSGDDFMAGIAEMTRSLVAAHNTPDPEYVSLFASPPKGDVIGVCPRCGEPVRESKNGFFCGDRACGFALWRDNRFFKSKKKEITKTTAAALLKEGRVFMSGLYSEKIGKTYDAALVMEPGKKGDKYVNFKLEFDGRKRK